MGDDAIALLARDGDREAAEILVSRYRPLVLSKARSFYASGAEPADMVQEGMIGLWQAIRDFQSHRAKFSAFADLCVTRQLVSAIKCASRAKHSALNNAQELDVNGAISPASRVAISIQCQQKLSPIERGAFDRFLEGKSYIEIAAEMSCTTKSIDNALQRVKRKLGPRPTL